MAHFPSTLSIPQLDLHHLGLFVLNAQEMDANEPRARAAKRAALTELCRNKATKKGPKASRRGIMTREKLRALRLMDLPPEIRVRIFQFVLGDDYHRLRDFPMPAITQVSQQLRIEATPIFFSSSTFSGRVMSNWGPISPARSSIVQARYEVGTVRLSNLFQQLDHPKPPHLAPTITENMVRFRAVDLLISLNIPMTASLGMLRLVVQGSKTSVVFIALPSRLGLLGNRVAMKAFHLKLDDVTKMCKGIEKRNPFNGFTIKDIKDIAMCFRG